MGGLLSRPSPHLPGHAAPRTWSRPLTRGLSGLLGLVLWLLAMAAAAQDVLPVPALSGRVIDQTSTLAPAQAAALQDKLAAFEAQSGPQIVVLIVPRTAPEDIAAYAQRVADTWKIGRRAVGDGLLLVVAKEDRAVRIEVAKALEGAVPDLAARQVIDRAIVPAFRNGDYAGGLNAGVDQLMARLRGEGLPAPELQRNRPSQGLPLDQVAIFFLIGVPVIGSVLSGLFGRKLGALLTAGAAGGLGWLVTTSVLVAVGAGVVALVLVGVMGVGSALGGGGRGRGSSWPHIGGWGGGYGGGGGFGGGGFGGGGGGGGGFSSGGGGDFGGGGASGRW